MGLLSDFDLPSWKNDILPVLESGEPVEIVFNDRLGDVFAMAVARVAIKLGYAASCKAVGFDSLLTLATGPK
jgi:hypothetical protein